MKSKNKKEVRVCRNIMVQNYYLDEIESRNKVEKSQYGDVFKDYMELMEEFGNV